MKKLLIAIALLVFAGCVPSSSSYGRLDEIEDRQWEIESRMNDWEWQRDYHNATRNLYEYRAPATNSLSDYSLRVYP